MTNAEAFDIAEQIHKLIVDLREAKKLQPELRIGTWNTPGSIINAYREGDLDFDDAVLKISGFVDAKVNEMRREMQEQADRIIALEGTLQRAYEALGKLRDYGRDQDIMDKDHGALGPDETGFVYGIASKALTNRTQPPIAAPTDAERWRELLRTIRFQLVGNKEYPPSQLEACQYNARNAVATIDAAMQQEGER